MAPGERERLRAHMLRTGIAGDTRTPRASVVANAEALAAGDPDKSLGLGAGGRDARGVMAAVAALCGCSDRLDERDGPGVIDPDAALDSLDAVGERLARAAAAGERVLVATGHPTGLLPMYQAVARALADAGAKLVTPIEGEALEPPAKRRRRRSVRYLDGVGVLLAGADLVHTHESWPMDALLDAAGDLDLVLADHGFAGAAIARRVETACFTDVNDPAIAVAWSEGLVRLVVPLDDNLPPSAYDPLRDHVIARIRTIR